MMITLKEYAIRNGRNIRGTRNKACAGDFKTARKMGRDWIIDENELQAELCDLLFERDYTKIAEQLKEYRKSETQKKLEAETDPVKRLEIMMNKPKVPKRSKRRRRRGLF